MSAVSSLPRARISSSIALVRLMEMPAARWARAPVFLTAAFLGTELFFAAKVFFGAAFAAETFRATCDADRILVVLLTATFGVLQKNIRTSKCHVV